MKDEKDELIPTRWTLIRRLKNLEDQESWREFFDTYWKLIYGVAIKAGLTHTEAQDVVQDTVISVTKNIAAFRADPAFGSFKSWLLNTTRWRITDQLRKRPREIPHRGGERGSTKTTAATPVEARVPDPAGSHLEKIWDEEWERHVIEAALQKLKKKASSRNYQVFYLYAIKQVPPERVAAMLEIEVNQVYLIKHRLAKVFEEAIKAVETSTGD
jgi:RNA polymerase sigma factor (sigma-70 family)